MTTSPEQPPSSPLLETREIWKTFAGVDALKSASITLGHGEVLGLVGENGAGKSTLAKIIAGVYQADSGLVLMDGHLIGNHGSPLAAAQRGIVTLYQDVGLVQSLTAEENLALFLSCQRRLPLPEARRRARFAIQADEEIRGLAHIPVAFLNQHAKQLIQALKARILDCRVLIADETSVSLTRTELIEFLGRVRELRDAGAGIIYISHALEEILEIADRIVVLRDGSVVADLPRSEANGRILSRLILGREVQDSALERAPSQQMPMFQAHNLCFGSQVRNLSLELRSGEITGVTGLEASGRHELARILGGVLKRDSGVVSLEGKTVGKLSPRRAQRLGISYLTGDRRAEGLMMNRSARSNFGLASGVSRWMFITSAREERRIARRYMEEFSIVPPNPELDVDKFSGGNQQKILLAMALAAVQKPKVLILHEPTVGVDVGARQLIHELIRRISDGGTAVVLTSFDVDEIHTLSDRLLILREGEIVHEFARGEASGHTIVEAVAG